MKRIEKPRIVAVRLSHKDFARLACAANTAEMTISDYIRTQLSKSYKTRGLSEKLATLFDAQYTKTIEALSSTKPPTLQEILNAQRDPKG